LVPKKRQARSLDPQSVCRTHPDRSQANVRTAKRDALDDNTRSDAPRNADVTALDYCQLLTMNKPDFQNFIGKHPELRARIDSIAAEREAMNRLDRKRSRGSGIG
jgi:CRP-like cAMP-binding protein